MKYQCIDCKIEFVGKRKTCPQCKSRFIIFVEQERQEIVENPSLLAEDDQPAVVPQQREVLDFEAEAKLKRGDLIKVIETVALLKMDVGDYYKVTSTKMDYYEKVYCLSPCDDKGVIEESGTREIPARSLDYWLEADNITILETAKEISGEMH